MAQIERNQVGPVEAQHHLGNPIVATGPEMDPGELEQIEQDEVGTNGASLLDSLGITREKMPDVDNL